MFGWKRRIKHLENLINSQSEYINELENVFEASQAHNRMMSRIINMKLMGRASTIAVQEIICMSPWEALEAEKDFSADDSKPTPPKSRVISESGKVRYKS